MGIIGTTVDSGVREGDVVTTLSLPTRTDRDIRVGGARGNLVSTTPITPPIGRTEILGWRSRRCARRIR